VWFVVTELPLQAAQ